MDAAYNGNWHALLSIAVRPGYDFVTRDVANSTRLRPEPDANGQNALEWKPSGYTALHQAAWWGAPIEVVRGLIELGASRAFIIPTLFNIHLIPVFRDSGGIRTTDGKRQRPLDIAREKGHKHLYDILTPRGLPEISDDELSRVEAHFHKVILGEVSGDAFKPESMRLRLPDLGMLRDLPRVSMPVPGMFGVRNIISPRFCCPHNILSRAYASGGLMVI